MLYEVITGFSVIVVDAIKRKVEKNTTLNVMEQSLASGVTGFNVGKCVITSYSIHYTKLYDLVSMLEAFLFRIHLF